MKRFVSFFLAVLFLTALTGCGRRSLDDIIRDEPSLTGIVSEVSETSCIVEQDGMLYHVSLDVENSDSFTDLSVGDEIVVYYDGTVAESWPMQINKVYAITLKTPAGRINSEK